MKKQNKKQEDILGKSWMFLIIIFIVIDVYLFYDFFNKPEFTIYKNECENETLGIGIDWKNERNYGENHNISSFVVEEFGYFGFEEELCKELLKKENGSILFERAKYYPNGVGVGFECIGRKLIKENKLWKEEKKIEIFWSNSDLEAHMVDKGYIFDYDKVYLKDGILIQGNKYFYAILKANLIKGICEKVEVDEVEYERCYNATRHRTKEEFCKYASDYERTRNKEDVNRCMNSGMYEYDMGHNPEANLISTDTINCNIQIISKKDITKEWLDETCECQEGTWECKSGKLTEDCFDSNVNCCYIPLSSNRPEPDYKCSKYKCEDYEVKQ